MTPFLLSIEPTEGESFIYGFNLGTIEKVARDCAVDIFRNRKEFHGKGAITIRTVALMVDGKIFDVYDGRWNSEYVFDAD